MTNQAIDVAAWHDFFATLGTAAAALLGLLFVALSLRGDLEPEDLAHEQGIWSIGGASLLSFADVLVTALTLLVPHSTELIVAVPVAVMALVAGLTALRVRGRVRVLGDTRVSVSALVIPLVCGAQLICAVAIGFGHAAVLPWLALIVVILLIISLMTAWFLLAAPAFARVTSRVGGKGL